MYKEGIYTRQSWNQTLHSKYITLIQHCSVGSSRNSAAINHCRFDKRFCMWELRYDLAFSQAVTLMILRGRWTFGDLWFSHHPTLNLSAYSLPASLTDCIYSCSQPTALHLLSAKWEETGAEQWNWRRFPLIHRIFFLLTHPWEMGVREGLPHSPFLLPPYWREEEGG